MYSRRIFICALIVPCLLGVAHASGVYKCTSVQGSITFQDHPCNNGDAEVAIHLADTPPAAPAQFSDARSAARGESPSNPGPPPTPVANPLPGASLPPLWVCTRPEDGSHYISRDGVITPRMVPAGILGVPGQSLSSAYGGSSGIGVSAPGVRRIPVDKSPQAAVAGDYIAVQDTCERATQGQTCNYLQEQFDQIHQKLKRAFKDEQALLQPREDELSQQLDGC